MYDALQRLSVDINIPRLLIIDFNVIVSSDDKQEGLPSNNYKIIDFLHLSLMLQLKPSDL